MTYGTCAASYAPGVSRNTTGACEDERLMCFASSLARVSSDSPARHSGYSTSTLSAGAKLERNDR